MCEAILPSDYDICAINYFTARVSDTEKDPGLSTRQDVYLRALSAYIPEFKVHFGHFSRKTKRLLVADPPPNRIKVWHVEEKGSDVNLAVHLLNDAWHDKYECAIVISNDSDLVEGINLAKARGKIVGIITTKNKATAKLMSVASFHLRLDKDYLKNCLLPDTIPGTTIRKPDEW